MSLKDTITLIHSTFNDMHIESKHIIKETFLKLTENKIMRFANDLKSTTTEKEIPTNKINKNRKFFSFLEQHYGLIYDSVRDINGQAKKRYNLIVDEMPVSEMEIGNDLLNHIFMHLKEKDFVSLPIAHSLFFSRNPSYLDELLSSQLLIYTNHSEIENDKIKLSDVETAKNKQKFTDKESNKGMKIESCEPKINKISTECSKSWNTKILIPQDCPCKTDEGNRRLTSFKLIRGGFLKDVFINQFKDGIGPEFLKNMTFNAKSYLEKILNQKGISYHANGGILISRLKYAQIIKSNIDHGEICLASAEPCYEKTLILSRSNTDSHDASPDEKSCKQFLLTSDLMNEISSLWKSIEDFNPKSIAELKWNILEIFLATGNKSVFSIFDAANQMHEGVKLFDEIQDNLKLIMILKENENNELFNPNLQNIENRNIISGFEIQSSYYDSKKELTKKYFKDYLKSHDENQIGPIYSFEYFKNPLFLKILLRELKSYNSSEILLKN